MLGLEQLAIGDVWVEDTVVRDKRKRDSLQHEFRILRSLYSNSIYDMGRIGPLGCNCRARVIGIGMSA